MVSVCKSPSYCPLDKLHPGYNYTIDYVGKAKNPIVKLEKVERCQLPECDKTLCYDDHGKLVSCQSQYLNSTGGEELPSYCESY